MSQNEKAWVLNGGDLKDHPRLVPLREQVNSLGKLYVRLPDGPAREAVGMSIATLQTEWLTEYMVLRIEENAKERAKRGY